MIRSSARMVRAGASLMEAVEGRVFLSGTGQGRDGAPGQSEFVYVSSNNPVEGQNAILAYRRTRAGGLVEVPGGPFLTGGTGFENTDERLGPDDSDQEIVVSKDGKYLYAVNSGSDTIAAFEIDRRGRDRGGLRRIGVFDSGGENPVSIGLAGDFAYVVNKSDQDPGETAGDNPNITAFKVGKKGALAPVAGGTVELPAGAQPSQAHVSPDGKQVFVIELFVVPFDNTGLPPFVPAASSRLTSYSVGRNGVLTEVDEELPTPVLPFLLGMDTHPSKRILYTGHVLDGSIGVYTYDRDGELTFVGKAATGPADFGVCWIRVTKDGKYAYATNATTNTVSVFSLRDPLHPVQVQSVALAGPKEPVPQPAPVLFSTTPFQLELSPDDRTLYVVNHEATLANDFPDGNALHTLSIGRDGLLTEREDSPLIFSTEDVPANAHPKGVVVV